MTDKNKKPTSDDDDIIIEEELVTYTRKRRLYKFVCNLENCPFCRNEKQYARHPSKKWCSEEARAEARRRERARVAIDAQRDPGAIGKPIQNIQSRLGVIYLHVLDKPKRLDGTSIYRLGSSPSWEEYQGEYLDDSNIRNSFDAVIITMLEHADSLAHKIARKNEDKQQDDGLFYLADSDVRIAHQIVIEHKEAYAKITETNTLEEEN
ncbi:MAG: hypothetical protein AAFU54_18960 [Chloroflexota bacterium]